MCASTSPERNLACFKKLVREAAGRGARYIQTPENTNIMERDRERLLALAEADDGGPFAAAAAELARELAVVVHVGSLATRIDGDRLANRSLLFGPDGALIASYDKIHMFDVDLPGGESYRESARFRAGEMAVAATVGPLRLGLTVCYDLRFPALYATLAAAGCNLIAVPSAFTRQTGEAHWHVLLRARAIECNAVVAAAAQTGRHENGRETYGHSLLVAADGGIIAEADDDVGVTVAEAPLPERRVDLRQHQGLPK